MSGINVGKVVVGGLIAGVVMNLLDFLNNAFVMAEDFRANATRLGLDPAAMESTAGMVTWVVIDFLMGLLLVWIYAAIRPRFGPGPKTAVIAALMPFLAVALIIFGLTQGGMMTMGIFWKMTPIQLVILTVSALAGAASYREA